MNPLFAELARGHRDALVAYYLGQIVPRHSVQAGRGLVTEQDLYQFLLIDNQVGASVETSRIAMGMASIQQYLHAIFNGMEPGYLGLLDGGEQQEWQLAKGEYAIWAANQMLRDYPENYIEPDLRLKQTEAFRSFINDTEQSRISDDSVQRALQHYLDKFERISNLRVVSGYIDGLDFHNADYYLIGRQNVEPHAWFWRKAAVRFGPAGEKPEGGHYLSPTAWSEWLPVEIPKAHEVLQIRPLLIEGRLYVAWVERREAQKPVPAARAEVPGLYESVARYSLNIAYRSLQGNWSVPMSYDLALEDDPGESLLVAFVNQADPDDKKIIVAFAASATSAVEALVLDARFNLLFQGEVDEDATPQSYLERILSGLWSFVDRPAALQHPLATDKATRVVVSDVPGGEYAHAGPYNNRLRLECAMGFSAQGALLLYAQGFSDLRSGYHAPASTTLEIKGYRAQQQVFERSATVELNGKAQTFRIAYGSVQTLPPDAIALGFVDEPYHSVNHYAIEIPDAPVISPELVDNAGGQYLDLHPLGLEGLRYVRLNTLFARELVARATISLEALINWDTQHIQEPPLPDSEATQPMDFHGANGRYFWELFFHIPHAVAWRLHHEFNHKAAERWLHRIFNPQARVKPTSPPSPFYWSVRPLDEPGRGEYEIDGIADPDAICYSEPVHYRKAIFAFYVRNLLAYGDLLYRRLTRDSLTEAQLVYTRALDLLGPRPDNRMVGRWQAVSLEEAATPDEALFTALETQLPPGLPLHQRSVGAPWLELLDNPRFRLPVNTALLDLWSELHSRITNLRENRTLDGKPLLMPLYTPPADPKDLLRAQNSGSGLVQRSVGSLAPIPPFRFRALLPRLHNAVETLSRFGEQVRIYREMKDRAEQEELQQAHVLELSQFAIQLQEAALEQGNSALAALQASRRVIEQRREHYARLATTDVSRPEQESMDLQTSASVVSLVGQGLETAAGAMQMGSVIVTAFGGGHNRLGAALLAAGGALQIQAGVNRLVSDRLVVTEQYRRRHQEWTLQRDQAAAELEAIDEQIVAQQGAIEMVRVQIAQAGKAEQQSQDYYRFLKTRSTNAGLYQWLLSQMSTFYFQAYDAVVGLCLNGEACWNYEMGDYQTRFIQPNVWFDNHFGLTAGDALRLQLLRMEAAWLKRFERRQELVRTVSLKQHFDQAGGESTWNSARQQLLNDGVIAFELAPRLFDNDYPGHYLRQMVSLSVSLPALLGPYEEVRAVLTQVSSRTVLKADPLAMDALYGEGQANGNILYNPRASQSICLSRGLDDHGVFQLDFNDERYLPFEGTGVLSTWELRFPRHAEQLEMLESLTDIIVQLRYTALDGGPDFAAHVEKLLDG